MPDPTATPPRADLRTLAKVWADAICGPAPTVDPDDPPTRAEHRDWAEDHKDEFQSALVGLAAVLPEHRRMVLVEAAKALEALKPSVKHFWDTNDADRVYTLNDAVKTLRRLAAAAPETGPSATVPAENAPAVPEDTPGGFHEPDEPTDHVQAAFDAGTHGRTAPPRGQTRRLDVAVGGWRTTEDDALTYAEMEAERDRLAGEVFTLTNSEALAVVAAELERDNARAERDEALADRNRLWAELQRVHAQVAHCQRVVEAAKAWYAACDPNAITAPDVRAAGIQLAAAVDALPDTPLESPSTGTPAPKCAPKDADPTVAKSIGWEPTFFERRAARDPSIDHSSHSMQWVGKCPECPSDTAPAADGQDGDGRG